MKKKSFFLSLCALGLLAGCSGREQPTSAVQPAPETVQLTVWGAEEDEALLQEIISSFQSEYSDEADLRITYQAQSESNCKDVLLGDLENGADVFAFADDQVAALAAAGALGLTVIWALALPGKVAPVTAGAAIRDTIYNMLREKGL